MAARGFPELRIVELHWLADDRRILGTGNSGNTHAHGFTYSSPQALLAALCSFV